MPELVGAGSVARPRVVETERAGQIPPVSPVSGGEGRDRVRGFSPENDGVNACFMALF